MHSHAERGNELRFFSHYLTEKPRWTKGDSDYGAKTWGKSRPHFRFLASVSGTFACPLARFLAYGHKNAIPCRATFLHR